jgi:hypothetical protein
MALLMRSEDLTPLAVPMVEDDILRHLTPARAGAMHGSTPHHKAGWGA